MIVYSVTNGGVAEWSIASVLKTDDLFGGPRVRIPSPPQIKNLIQIFEKFRLLTKSRLLVIRETLQFEMEEK